MIWCTFWVELTEGLCEFKLTVSVLIYIWVRLWCFAKYRTFRASRPYLEFEYSNCQSKSLNIIVMLKYPWRSNLIFFKNFCYSLNGYKVCWSNDLCTIQNQRFCTHLKNINFVLQEYFNMMIMFNGLDRWFELLNSRYEREAREVSCFAMHHSLTIYIYIYIYIELGYGAL
jgi:hypothetical protein